MGSNKWDHYLCGPFWALWFINPWNSARNCTCLVQALVKHETVSELQSRSISVGSVYQEKLTSCLLENAGVSWYSFLSLLQPCLMKNGWGLRTSCAVCVLVGVLAQPLSTRGWWMLLCNRPATWVRAWPWTSMLAVAGYDQLKCQKIFFWVLRCSV